MKIPPKPPVGWLIAYEYVWASRFKGRDEGEKTYPVAIVAARQDLGPFSVAYVLAISHRAPEPGDRAMEVPPKLKRHLGLDDEPSWIYTDQANVFAWPGPDLRPADRLSSQPRAVGTCVVGQLPSDWFKSVTTHFEESRRLGLLIETARHIAFIDKLRVVGVEKVKWRGSRPRWRTTKPFITDRGISWRTKASRTRTSSA